MSIPAFLNEFDKRLYKTKSYGTVQSDNILAHRLLKSANQTDKSHNSRTKIWSKERSVKEKL